MLSAIAARKAAQAAQQSSNVQEQDPVAPPPPPTQTITSHSKPSSKRKSSGPNPNPPKRKKDKRTPAKNARLFVEEDSFRKQDDVIVIDSDEDDDMSDDLAPRPTTSKANWSDPNDSSASESDDVEAASISFETAISPPITAQQNAPELLSTFHPTPSQNMFFIDSKEVSVLQTESDPSLHATLVALAPEETLCLLGAYTFSVLQGSIMLSGVTISSSAKSYRVFAPRSAPLPVLEGVGHTSSIPNIHQLPQAVQSVISTPVALVLLQELHSHVEGLGDICRTFDGVFEPSRLQKSATSSLQLSGVYMIKSQTRDIQVFETPVSWQRALASKSASDSVSVHLVKGSKKSGKSTFARTLVNSLLNRYQKVAYLECDLGQSEFTPGGMVALNVLSEQLFGKSMVLMILVNLIVSVGPPFTHPTLPHTAHYIGETTPRASPSCYLAAIQAVLETYRLDIQTPAISWQTSDEDTRISDFIPLVVNTMGWNKGLGADLNLKIQGMVEPTDIYEVEAPADPAWPTPPPRDTYLIPTSHAANLHLLKAAPTSVLSTNYSAADHRSLSILSYFHAVFPDDLPPADELSQTTALTWHTSLSLCAQPPFEVDCAQAFDKVILSGPGTEDVVPSEVARVLNGALVALVSCTPGTLDLELGVEATSTPIPYTQGFTLPSPASSRCLGLALIRSVSVPDTHVYFHVLTPIPPKELAEGRVVVKGELELPIWGMLDHTCDGDQVAGVEPGKVPYLQWGKGEGAGGERRRIRRNLMRRGQM